MGYNLKHFTPIQQRFNDYDILGHVNNAVFQHYFDLARIRYFAEILGENIVGSKYSLVMATINIDFHSPVLMQESISIKTGIEVLGNKSITMIQEIINPETNELKSSSRATLVTYCVQDKSSCLVPEEWKEKVIAYEDQVELKKNNGN